MVGRAGTSTNPALETILHLSQSKSLARYCQRHQCYLFQKLRLYESPLKILFDWSPKEIQSSFEHVKSDLKSESHSYSGTKDYAQLCFEPQTLQTIVSADSSTAGILYSRQSSPAMSSPTNPFLPLCSSALINQILNEPGTPDWDLDCKLLVMTSKFFILLHCTLHSLMVKCFAVAV